MISPQSGKVSATFSAVAKHYGVKVRPCPPRRGNRKGVVEKANHVAAQRFWRTLPDDVSVQEAQGRLDAWCTKRGDTRIRATADGRSSVATVAAAEPLAPVPAPFPALLSVARVVSAQALVSSRGNRYSVPPELHGATVTLSVRLGSTHLDIASSPTPGRTSVAPVILARHLIAATGAGATVRDHGHVLALERSAMAASTTERPHRRKERRPPSPAARAQAATLRSRTGPAGAGEQDHRVVDLAAYAAAAAGRNTLAPAQPTPPSETIEETTPQ